MIRINYEWNRGRFVKTKKTSDLRSEVRSMMHYIKGWWKSFRNPIEVHLYAKEWKCEGTFLRLSGYGHVSVDMSGVKVVEYVGEAPIFNTDVDSDYDFKLAD